MNDFSLPNSNYWACRRDYPFIAWEATLPITRSMLDDIYLLTDDIIALGQKYAVYDVVELSDSPSDFKKSGITYGQFMKTISETIGYYRFFPDTYMAVSKYTYPAIAVNSRLCYYDADGNLIEGDVSNLGKLLADWIRDDKFKQQRQETYNPVSDLPPQHMYIDEVQPLTISSSNIPFKALSGEKPYDFQLEFITHTDIWFPWVAGYNFEWTAVLKNEMYDNRTLANYHTPRLNAFLAEAKTLIEHKGGTWKIGEETSKDKRYTWQISETEILLDSNPYEKHIIE